MTQPYVIIRKLRIINKTGNTATFSLWVGATGANAAGTEVYGQGTSVPANSAFEDFDGFRMDVADFLVGGAGTATALTLVAAAEIGFV